MRCAAGLLALCALAGCGPASGPETGETPETLLVYASFYPMYDFAAKIGGDRVRVVNMVPAGTEPHDWEPAAADVAGLEAADVFVYNGAGFEHWVDDVLGSLENRTLVTVEASRGVAPPEETPARPGVAEARDPHVWLSPLGAKAEMENIRDALVQADPEGGAVYETNCARWTEALDALDKEFRETLDPLPRRDVVVSHRAFGYLCADYGLNQVAVEGLSPDAEPDPARLAEVIELAGARDVRVIFFEETVSPKVAEVVAKAVGAQTGVLSPLESLSDERRAAGADYISVMRDNLAALRAALA
jgi:zinc transport system substrate-binding protein